MAETVVTEKGMQARPGVSDIYIIESAKRGHGRFVGRITPGGERLFYYRYTPPKMPRVMLPIGPFDSKGDGVNAYTVLQARNKARALAALYLVGQRDLRGHLEQVEKDARQAAADARQAEADERSAKAAAAIAAEQADARRVTVRKLFGLWQAGELAPHVLTDGTRQGRKDGGEYVRAQFERHVFPAIGHTAAEDVVKGDLLGILSPIKASGRLRTVNVLFSDMRQMFGWAVENLDFAKNPLEGSKRHKVGSKETERARKLIEGEIRHLAALMPLAGMGPRTVAAVWVILATGCRIGELVNAEWRHVDTVARTWFLPTTKNERDHTIHLSDFALRQFEALAQLKEAGPSGATLPWVFPNSKGTGPLDIKTIGKQLSDRQRVSENRLSRRTKNSDALLLPGGRWTAHDLRRTAATVMATLGISGDVIDECLNHMIESRVRRTYVHDRRLPEQARAFDALGARLESLIRAKPMHNNVQAIRAA